MVQLLDCTLRDGGYYTSWDFKPDLLDAYFDNLARLPVDLVEAGYVNDETDGYYGEFYFLRPARIADIKRRLRADQKLLVMLDAKSAAPERIDALFAPLVGVVDGVRIAAAPDALGHAMALARRLKAIGITVGLNVMYLSTYCDDVVKLQPAVDAAEAIDSLALVDSYGGCTPGQVGDAVRALRQALPSHAIGFHGHDNLCLALANTLAAMDAGANVVDGAFVGMGRGAGNTRTEALLVHLARRDSNIELDHQALAAVVAPFEALRRMHGWGTNLPYMISGANNLPQRDVMDWLAKSRYSVASIIRALQRQSGQETDRIAYPSVGDLGLVGRQVLLIGGGASVADHIDAVAELVRRYAPVIVFSSSRHLGLADRIGGRQLLCLPGHDAIRFSAAAADRMIAAVVAAPPRVPGCLPDGLRAPVHQATPITFDARGAAAGPVSDSGPLALGLGVVRELGVEQCWLIGFDGYEHATSAQQDLAREVQGALDAYAREHGRQSIASLTPTRYDVRLRSLHALLSAAGGPPA